MSGGDRHEQLNEVYNEGFRQGSENEYSPIRRTAVGSE